MGARKRLRAEKLKAEKRVTAIASLRECPTSPRKMRLVADMIRLRSAIANWEAKNQGVSLEETPLCVKTIFVDGGRQLKRIQPASRGRAYRIRKRSNHVTIIVDRMAEAEQPVAAATEKAAPAKKKAAPAAKKAATDVKPENAAN